MPKPGNWGTWATIEHIPSKRKCKNISCELCVSYKTKEKLCTKNPACKPLFSWKACKSFYFKPPYDTSKYWNKLIQERGYL